MNIDFADVTQPEYYNSPIPAIDFIETHELNFNLGNVIKYIARAGKKENETTLTALNKASWYLNREISRVTKESNLHDGI